MRVLFVAVLVVFVSCKKDAAPTEVAPKAAPAPAAAPPVAAAPERKSPLEVVAKGDAVLSVFEPVKDTCEWRRVDAATKASTVVATFPGSCVGARVSWSKDGATAAVWFDPKLVQTAGMGGSDVGAPGYPDETVDEAAKDRFFVVKVASGVVKDFPRPSADIEELGVNPKGEVLAFSLETLGGASVEAGKTTVDGKDFPLTKVEEGLPALAHAWQLSGKGWTRVETVQTTTGWDYARGVSELAADATLGARSTKVLETHPGSSTEVEDAMKAKLKAFAPAKGEGEWTGYGEPGSRVFDWVITAEFGYTTGLLVFEAGKLERAANIGFTDGELVSLHTQGPFLLVSSGSAGAHPRLYDLRSKALQFTSDTARAVTFWP